MITLKSMEACYYCDIVNDPISTIVKDPFLKKYGRKMLCPDGRNWIFKSFSIRHKEYIREKNK